MTALAFYIAPEKNVTDPGTFHLICHEPTRRPSQVIKLTPIEDNGAERVTRLASSILPSRTETPPKRSGKSQLTRCIAKRNGELGFHIGPPSRINRQTMNHIRFIRLKNFPDRLSVSRRFRRNRPFWLDGYGQLVRTEIARRCAHSGTAHDLEQLT
jgi:hypothetical protein